ncbi:hypothetical protein F511_35597 [Dorcoceras hygrometricum]|uniref:Uncharacterized protein n=1 Tax=Dorcoceras hygrometricum TaxID=472368 RepID=A0A2Z7B0A3_9LAMI|nr:hypothetical protein F511_35597 [Dorcoceras hygrometricum]
MVNAGLWENSAFERRASIHRVFLAKRQRLVKICFGRAMERSDRHCTGRMRRRMMGSDLLSKRSDLQQTSSFSPAGRKSADGRNSAVDGARVKRRRFMEPAVARFDLRGCCWQAWLLARECSRERHVLVNMLSD